MDTMFVREKSGSTDLRAVAAAIFSSLGLSVSEERESSNYPEGFYFLGHGANASVKVSFGDDVTLPEFPFWVSLEAPISWAQPTTKTLPGNVDEVAIILSRSGFDAFVPEGSWGRKDWEEKGKLYAL